MARIPFAVHSYKLDSLPASAQDLINLWAEELPSASRSPVLVKNVPGLIDYATCGTGKVWALGHMGGDIYAVVGGFPNFSVYKVTETSGAGATAGTVTLIGITTGSVGAPVTMAASATQLVIATPPTAWVVSGGTLTKITDPDFPAITSVAYVGGFFCFTKQGSDQYIISNLLDATAYDALDIQSAEAVPDSMRRAVEHNNELWLFCDRSTEIHQLTGAADFPFERQSGGVIDVGTIAASSVAILDDGPYWLGSDLIVYRAVGYRQERISTHAIEQEIATFLQPELASGFSLTFGGHNLYVLTFPSTIVANAGPGRTFVYDATTKLWHKRASTFSGSTPDLWQVSCAAKFRRHTLCGGATGGQVLRMTDSTPLEDGVSLTPIATLPPQWAETGLGFADRLELELEPGGNASDMSVTLAWSDDGGHTFTSGVARSMGAPGDRSERVYWSRLGSFRQRVFRFTFAAGARVRAYGADLRKRMSAG